jgi:hypothetical protein
MKILEQLMTKTMTNTLYVVIFFCRLHFSLAVIIPDIYIYRVLSNIFIENIALYN